MNIMRWSVLVGAALLSACSLGPREREAPAVYDLGAARPVAADRAAPLPVTLMIPAVGAPLAFDHTGIVYRLNHVDASRPETYSASRWSAPPAQLLTERIRAGFMPAFRGVVTAQDGARADYLLRIDVEDFSQAFDAPERSNAHVRLRATLVNAATRALVAQRTVAASRPAGANAAGAAKALTEASDAATAELLAWSTQTLCGVKR